MLGFIDKAVLEWMNVSGGTVEAQRLYDKLHSQGQSKRVRFLFSKGFIAGDEIPARNVTITDAGRKALAESQ